MFLCLQSWDELDSESLIAKSLMNKFAIIVLESLNQTKDFLN